MPDRREAPIIYFSRTLSLVEWNNAQIDKEALTLIISVENYVYRRHFKIATNHKALLGLFAQALSVHKGYLLWENRVIVLSRLHQQVLEALHMRYLGISDAQ